MADSSYVQMGNDGPRAGNVSALVPGLDDPNLSQEEKDYRLAIALQQQENAAVQAAKKKHDASVAAQHTRVSRSGVNTALAHIRKQQKSGDAGGAYSPTSSGDYYAPDDGSADAQLARKLQDEEMEAAGTAKMLEKIVKDDVADKKAAMLRTGRSGHTGATVKK